MATNTSAAIFEAGCRPSLSTATIEFIPKAVKGRERKFVIQARDSQDKPYPKGSEPVYATIRLMGSEESPTSLAVTEIKMARTALHLCRRVSESMCCLLLLATSTSKEVRSSYT